MGCRALPDADMIPFRVSCSEIQARLFGACRQPLPGAAGTTPEGGLPTDYWDA